MCDCPRQSIDFDSLRGAPPSSPGEGLAPLQIITRFVEWYHAIQRQTFFHLPLQIQTYHDSGLAAGWRQIAAATVGGYHISDCTIQPHRVNIPRGGRQDCRPYMPYGDWYHSSARGVFGMWHVSGFSPQAFHGLWNFSVDNMAILESSENLCVFLSLYPLVFAAEFRFLPGSLLKFLHIL